MYRMSELEKNFPRFQLTGEENDVWEVGVGSAEVVRGAGGELSLQRSSPDSRCRGHLILHTVASF